jgi:hypothetical protein
MDRRPRSTPGTATTSGWHVKVRFRPRPPWPISERLEAAERIEDDLRRVVRTVSCSVLVYSDGLSVAVHVEAEDQDRALEGAADLLERALGAHRLRELGDVAVTSVRHSPNPARYA